MYGTCYKSYLMIFFKTALNIK